MFRPDPSPWGPPPVYLAGVGDRMVALAGELADGLLVHSFSSPRSLREHTLPILESVVRRSGRARQDVEVSLPLLVATGVDPAARRSALDRVRGQVAFYASTPAYRWILGLHGLEELGARLTALSRAKDPESWTRMAQVVDDETVDRFAIVAEPGAVGAAVRARYGGLVDRVSLYAPYPIDPGVLAEIAADIRTSPAPGDSAAARPPRVPAE
jgi:probable F420-dependent oxidoreductase